MSDPNRREPSAARTPNLRELLITAALLNWCRRPRAQANRAIATVAALSVAWVTVFAWPMADRAVFLRDMAMMFVIAHCGWHFLVLRALRRLMARAIPGADEALGAYLDPLRISHFDVAAAWLAFALVVRFVDLISS
jgi:hypothetical protein